MSDTNVNDLNAVVKSIDEIKGKLDSNYATKNDLNKLNDSLKELAKISDENCKQSKKHAVFGNEKVAGEFVEFLGGILEETGINKKVKVDKGFNVDKATLNVTTTTAGGYLVPTAVATVLEELVSEGGKARQLHDVLPVAGSLDLGVGDTDAAATYATNDTTAIGETDRTFSKVTLSPKQMGALFRASGKLLNESAVPIASMIASSLARAAGVLEDQTVLYADGTATYSSQTGYEDNTSIACTSVASVAACTIDDLIALQSAVHESIDPTDSAYYLNRALIVSLRQRKGTTYDQYYLDPQTQQFYIGGVPVVEWKRMHSGTTNGDMIAMYGQPRRAGKIGVGREMSIAVSSEVDFAKAGFVWRLLQDFGFVIPNPGAVAKVRITSST